MKLAAWILFAPALLAQTATVTGTVTNAITHEPIPGASVVMVRIGATPKNATTDANGAFRVTNLEPGDYNLLTMRIGFEPAAEWSKPTHIEDGAGPAPLSLSLMPWPTLSGRVLDPDRQPIGGIPVTAVPITGVSVPPVTTDKNGRYAFKLLPPGQYALLANPLGSGKSDFAPTYFPNAGDRANGERIAAKAGAELSGYDIVLRAGPFLRISGRVLDDAGRPAAHATVEVQTPDASFGKTETDSEGAFAFEHVPPIDGLITAVSKAGGVELRAFSAIVATRHDIENVVVRLSPPIEVRGTVELDGESVAPGPGVYTMLAPADGVGKRVAGLAKDDELRFDAAYPGRYKLFFITSPSRSYLDSVWLGDRDITMQEFDAAPGMLPLRVALRSDGGTVRATFDQTAAGGQVVLIPQEERLRFQPFLRNGILRNGGQLEISNVRPGDYYALALQGPLRMDDLQNPAVLAPLLPSAASVHVERGATATVSLRWQQSPMR